LLQDIKRSPNYRRWVIGTIAIGSFLSVVDHGSVMVALPQIESHFNSDLPTVQWPVIGYALAISVFLFPMGRLGDIIPRKHVYTAGFVIFVLAAALAGASPNPWTLISAKVVQGNGSAMIQLIRNSANVTSVAMATAVVVVTMDSRGVAPSLDAVTPQVAEPFVAGLHRAFFLMACLLAAGAVLSFIRGERKTQPASPTQPARVGEAAPEAPDS